MAEVEKLLCLTRDQSVVVFRGLAALSSGVNTSLWTLVTQIAIIYSDSRLSVSIKHVTQLKCIFL